MTILCTKTDAGLLFRPENIVQKGKPMIARVKAKFTNGHIVPLERLDIEEGAELSVDVEVESRASDQERMKRTMSAAGGWKGAHEPEAPSINDVFDDIRKSLSHIPKEPGPTDGAKNYKHYLCTDVRRRISGEGSVR